MEAAVFHADKKRKYQDPIRLYLSLHLGHLDIAEVDEAVLRDYAAWRKQQGPVVGRSACAAMIGRYYDHLTTLMAIEGLAEE